jgi:CheY-like chemotaxis protein
MLCAAQLPAPFHAPHSLMPHVLVVDDDADVRELLDMFLATSGYSITSASNGAEALTRMREQRPCLVLLDLMMPVMNGWQFREKQLEDPKLSDVPVVCISAAYHPSEVSQRLGIPCLQKPIDLEKLLSVVHECCNGGAAR